MRRGIAIACVIGALFGLWEFWRHRAAMVAEAARLQSEQDSLRKKYPFQSLRERLAAEAARLQSEQDSLRKKYPFQSLRERLAYESKAAPQPVPKVLTPIGTPEHVRHYVNSKFNFRADGLRKLHYANAEDFFRMPEQGVRRMVIFAPAAYLEGPLEPLPQPVAFDESPYRSDALPEQMLELAQFEPEGSTRRAAPALSTLSNYVYDSANVFGNSSANGYSESLDRVAGFTAHGFARKPVLATLFRGKGHSTWISDYNAVVGVWRTTRLELVSLLKQDPPRVYLSKNFPAMDELAQAKTRALNDFERHALAELFEGEGVVTTAATNTICMLGALRARHECLDCHSVEENTLLGAFSYTLERDPPLSTQQLADWIKER